MTFKVALEKLLDSKEFQDWNKDEYLTHGFKVDNGWELGFYNKDTDKITTFTVTDSIYKGEEQEVFKESGTVRELNPEMISMTLAEIENISKGILEIKYNTPIVLKKIIIIQNIEGNHVYNVTFVTNAFKTINIKIDADTGKVISDKEVNLMQFQK